MSLSDPSERIRQAARDGYLDILRDSTRKECNTPDEDGMTATHWAAYTGNLNALRIIVGRGGDAEKCDNLGNTALHWCANNGHFNCASFLISFGVNLWSMDNQYHTAKEIAALNNREEIVQLIDDVIAQQNTTLNTKAIQKLKEKALSDAEKRIRNFRKFQNKTARQAEKEEKQREKNLKNLFNSNTDITADDGKLNLYVTLEKKSKTSISQFSTPSSQVPKFSDLVNSTITSKHPNKMKIFTGVSRKVMTKKHNNNNFTTDTIKSSSENGTCRSVQSMIGIRRDDHIVYVPKFNSLSINDIKDGKRESHDQDNNRLPLKDVFNYERLPAKTNTFNKNIKTTLKNKLFKLKKYNNNGNNQNKPKSNLFRAVSEPDFLQKDFINGNMEKSDIRNNSNNTNSSDFSNEVASIFERPGFGSVSFRGKFTPELMFSSCRYYDRADSSINDDINSEEDGFDSGQDHSHSSNNTGGNNDDNNHHDNNNSNSNQYSTIKTHISTPDVDSFASDSIGSAGSLVHQDYLDEDFNHNLHYHPHTTDDDVCSESKTVSVLLFLYAHGLKDYYEIFEAEQIDIESLMLLKEKDLITLGIPLGPRRKLINAIQQRRIIFNNIKNNKKNNFETKL